MQMSPKGPVWSVLTPPDLNHFLAHHPDKLKAPIPVPLLISDFTPASELNFIEEARNLRAIVWLLVIEDPTVCSSIVSDVIFFLAASNRFL